jgi:membrane protease YdiL (CAAX protease family)
MPSALRTALTWASLLAIYGNAFNLVAHRVNGRRRPLVHIGGPLALLTGVVVWHRAVERNPLERLGFHWQDWRRDLWWGSAAGATMAALPALWFRLPGRRTALQFAEVQSIGALAFLTRLFVTTPVLVALVEEVCFRGFLQGKLCQALPTRPRWAIALSSLSFALWHVTVNVTTLRRTNVLHAGLVSLPVALAGGLISVFIGGLVFGGLHYRRRGLVAPVVAHWVVDALMLLALYDGPNRKRRP